MKVRIAPARLQRETPRRRRRRWVVVTGSVVLVVLIAAAYAWKAETPEAIMKKFVAAIENQDAATVHSLIIPDEVKALNLTEQKVETILKETLWKYGKVKASVTGHGSNTGPQRDAEIWAHTWVLQATGQPLMRTTKNGKAKVFTHLLIAPTKSGWRANFTQFIMIFCMSRTQYAAVCRKAGIKGYWEYGVENPLEILTS